MFLTSSTLIKFIWMTAEDRKLGVLRVSVQTHNYILLSPYITLVIDYALNKLHDKLVRIIYRNRTNRNNIYHKGVYHIVLHSTAW